jgi:hypothetical protein
MQPLRFIDSHGSGRRCVGIREKGECRGSGGSIADRAAKVALTPARSAARFDRGTTIR